MKTNSQSFIGYPIWVDKLMLPFRYGSLVTGALIFVVIWSLLGLVGGEVSFLLR
jgi:hypothetical protein